MIKASWKRISPFRFEAVTLRVEPNYKRWSHIDRQEKADHLSNTSFHWKISANIKVYVRKQKLQLCSHKVIVKDIGPKMDNLKSGSTFWYLYHCKPSLTNSKKLKLQTFQNMKSSTWEDFIFVQIFCKFATDDGKLRTGSCSSIDTTKSK
jgi:hypothetical protein